jgi:hypothetical protein
MTYAVHRGHLAPYFADTRSSSSPSTANKPGLLRRFFDAIVDARQQSADREIARQLERSGGRLTDSIEREIIENLMSGNLKFRN